MDEKGEVIHGRGEEMVQLLCQSNEEEVGGDKLIGEIKSEGLSNALNKR